ncbi:MAG: Flp pilus assembly complex ATPase component TadA [Actinobacteria bacterium]|nr:Flp pilus assembly complex ATPase component TadA [Actinomycetota bacterium]
MQLDQLLLARHLLTDEQLEEARDTALQRGRSLGRVLIELGYVSEAGLVAILAEQLGLEFIDLSETPLDASAVGLVPQTTARRHSCIPVRIEDEKLILAMADPANVVAVDDIRALTKRDVRTVVATKVDVQGAISRYYRLDSAAESLAEEAATAHDDEQKSLEEAVGSAGAEDAPIIKLVNMLITQAVNDRASDIHIEPQERDVLVRYRVDGVLHEVMRPRKSVQAGMTSRLKIMADVNIAERRLPQDGRISLTVQGKQIDIRLATLPTVYGEKIVMRILDKSSVLLELSDLGFLPGNFERFEKSFVKPYGEILVTGPTGSGKSTTLYATLNILNKPDRNIITVEDPVEYRLPGVNQVQTNPKAGLTFSSALRSILRSDPDVVLIGEIRDRETAQIATEAALTGHLVLSTLHTNDAPSALTRLIEMGIEPYLVSSALDCVLAQRLARKLCEKCKEPYVPTDEELHSSHFPMNGQSEPPKLFKAAGCSTCAGTGYKGRMALHEVMPVTEELERCVVEGASSEVAKKVAIEQGMLTLREDGMAKVLAGKTSIQEILRVVV